MAENEVVPPNNELAEAAILASMQWAARPELAKRYATELDEEDFYRSRHKVVFRAIRELVAAEEPVDVITVHARLAAGGVLQDAGGLKGLMELWAVTPNAVYHDAYARTLRALRARRELATIAHDMGRSATVGTDETDTLIQSVETRIQELQARAVSFSPIVSMGEAADSWEAAMLQRSKTEHADDGVLTFFTDLDHKIGPLPPGRFSVLMARPGMGKSAMGLQIAKAAGCAGNPVLIFPVETGIQEAMERYGAQGLDVPAMMLRQQRFGRSESEQQRIRDAKWSLSILPISWVGTPLIQLSELRARALGWARRHCVVKAGLILVDHLHLVRDHSSRAEGRRHEVTAITQAMKGLARETGCHIMGLCQLSREIDKRENRRPVITDARESGSIEEDADLIFGLYRPGYYSKSGGASELEILKNRNGPGGVVYLDFDAPKMRFSDVRQPPKDDRRTGRDE